MTGGLAWWLIGGLAGRVSVHQEPITTSLHRPHIPVTEFSPNDLFQFQFTANSDPHKNLSDQSQART